MYALLRALMHDTPIIHCVAPLLRSCIVLDSVNHPSCESLVINQQRFVPTSKMMLRRCTKFPVHSLLLAPALQSLIVVVALHHHHHRLHHHLHLHLYLHHLRLHRLLHHRHRVFRILHSVSLRRQLVALAACRYSISAAPAPLQSQLITLTQCQCHPLLLRHPYRHLQPRLNHIQIVQLDACPHAVDFEK